MRLNSEKIRTLLFRLDCTQVDLAKETGISRNTITSVCNGKSCGSKTALKIAAALNVDVGELMEE